jgi:hypothetical protein
MHAGSLSNSLRFFVFATTFAKFMVFTKFSQVCCENFRGNEKFRETKFCEISQILTLFRMHFAFSWKLKNAFSFQPYKGLFIGKDLFKANTLVHDLEKHDFSDKGQKTCAIFSYFPHFCKIYTYPGDFCSKCKKSLQIDPP